MSPPEIAFGFTAEQIIEEGRVTDKEIRLMRSWLRGESLPKFTDEQIVLFLLSCDNQQELTRKTVRAFYNVRNETPDIFHDRKLGKPSLERQLKTMRFCVLPERTEDGCVIIFFKFHDTYFYHFEFGPTLMLLFMTLDAALYHHPPKGLIILADLKGMGFLHLTKLRPGLIMKFFQYVQEGLPVKLKCIHVLNSTSIVNRILSLIKPFAHRDVLDVIYFHPPTLSMEEFYKTSIPRKCLPEDLGGHLPCVETLHEENIRKLTDLQDHFEAEEHQRYGLKNI